MGLTLLLSIIWRLFMHFWSLGVVP